MRLIVVISRGLGKTLPTGNFTERNFDAFIRLAGFADSLNDLGMQNGRAVIHSESPPFVLCWLVSHFAALVQLVLRKSYFLGKMPLVELLGGAMGVNQQVLSAT